MLAAAGQADSRGSNRRARPLRRRRGTLDLTAARRRDQKRTWAPDQRISNAARLRRLPSCRRTWWFAYARTGVWRRWRAPCIRRGARPAPGWLRALPPSPEGLATPASRGARLPRRAAQRGAEVECAATRNASRRSMQDLQPNIFIESTNWVSKRLPAERVPAYPGASSVGPDIVMKRVVDARRPALAHERLTTERGPYFRPS